MQCLQTRDFSKMTKINQQTLSLNKAILNLSVIHDFITNSKAFRTSMISNKFDGELTKIINELIIIILPCQVYIFIQLHIYGIYCNIQCNFFFPIIHKTIFFKFYYFKLFIVELTRETQLPNFFFSPEWRMEKSFLTYYRMNKK